MARTTFAGILAGAIALVPLPAGAAAPVRTAPLILDGGGAASPEIGRRILQEAGGDQARILIIPLADPNPDVMGQYYLDFFHALGGRDLQVLLPQPEPTASQSALIASATGLFFGGGDPIRLLGMLGSPGWGALIRSARDRGALIAGTSAGAMIWGQQVILRGESLNALWSGERGPNSIAFAPGFSFLPQAIVDPHFSERGRFGRLLFATERFFPVLGIGIDPETALVVQPDGKIEVLGQGTVTLMRPSERLEKLPVSAREVRVRVLGSGEKADLAGDAVFGIGQAARK